MADFIELEDGEYQQLKKLQTDMKALDAAMQNWLEKAKNANAAHAENNAAFWQKIGKKYNLDLQKTMWVIHPTKKGIYAAQKSYSPDIL